MADGTKLDAIRKELDAWLEGFMNRPFRTIIVLLVLIISVGLVGISPRVANDAYSWLIHQKPQNPFSAQKVIFSNFIPQENDIIDLNHAGTLTPSPYNLKPGTMESMCNPDGTMKGEPLVPFREGIVLMLNSSITLASQNGTRAMTLHRSSGAQYYVFRVGTTQRVETGGRVFNVTLSYMNDLSTQQNGEYYSYVFNINEQ